jgi:photosystem II stability/assembly factor-like uncharacterized protein
MHLSRKKLALLALCISGGAQAATNWQVLKVGSGGYVRGLNIAPDGTTVVRTDTNGAYLLNGSAWVKLVTASSMPAAFIAQNPVNAGQGVYEIQIAPSNSSIMYMIFDGYVFKSANKGTTWTQTAFPAVLTTPPSSPAPYANANADQGTNHAQYGPRMAIDPHNPNIVYFGTSDNNLYVTTNGGTSWSAVTGIPASSDYGFTGILFYGNGSVVNGVTQTIYVSNNVNGVYVSNDGGVTWTLTTSGPTTVQNAAIDTSGNYYAVSGSSTVLGMLLMKYSSGSWTTTSAPANNNTMQAVAINPFNQSEVVVVCAGGQIAVSYNAGSTWSGYGNSETLVSTDIPWLAAGNYNPSGGFSYLDAGGLAFSPVTNGQLTLSAGTGVWTTTLPSSGFTSTTPYMWTDMSVGIEQLVANAILVPPVTGSSPILASWDRPFFKITNFNVYPSTYGPVTSSNIVAGWSLDYASSDPSFVVGLAEGSTEQSGYSTDGGSTWTYFPSAPPNLPGSSNVLYYGGTIAASTPQNIIWAPANHGARPYYTLNQGATWTAITLPGVSSYQNFDFAYYLKTRTVTADRVNANTFYLYYPSYGVFSTTNGGVTWTNVYSGNGGYIESNHSNAGFNSTIMSVPGYSGNLFYTGGWQTGSTSTTPANEPFYRSINGGATWTVVPNVLAVTTFGFGAAAAGQSYPAIYIVGYVNNVFGIWQSVDNANSWTNIGTYPTGELDLISTISGDPNNYGAVYVGFSGGGFAYLPAGASAQPIPMAPANLTVH